MLHLAPKVNYNLKFEPSNAGIFLISEPESFDYAHLHSEGHILLPCSNLIHPPNFATIPLSLIHISFSVSFLFLITCELFAIFCALSFSYSFFPDSDLLMLGPFQIVSSRIIGDQFHLSSSSKVPARVPLESCSNVPGKVVPRSPKGKRAKRGRRQKS